MWLPSFPTLKGVPWRRIALVLGFLVLADCVWTLVWFPRLSAHRVFTSAELPQVNAPALVLGAGVLKDREPTQVLQNRLETALALYNGEKARWFLVSGDNRTPYYNEPLAMRRWLQKEGVPAYLIVSDYAGRRTYDSLRRAQAIFGIHRLVIVTSDYHLPRAIYTAQALGLDAWGVPSPIETTPWPARVSFWFREYVARHKAVLDVWLPPDTLLGPREPTPEDWMGIHETYR